MRTLSRKRKTNSCHTRGFRTCGIWPVRRAALPRAAGPARELGMTSDTSLATLDPAPSKPEAPPRCKFRVRFSKADDLRLVSHHDLMHVCERMFRRADLSVPVTQGFNPR